MSGGSSKSLQICTVPAATTITFPVKDLQPPSTSNDNWNNKSKEIKKKRQMIAVSDCGNGKCFISSVTEEHLACRWEEDKG